MLSAHRSRLHELGMPALQQVLAAVALDVVGQGVARSLGLKVGDRVTLVITLDAGALNTLEYNHGFGHFEQISPSLGAVFAVPQIKVFSLSSKVCFFSFVE